MQSFAYTLDKAGNRQQLTELGGGTIAWTYDNLYHLTAETRGSATTQFHYDAAGNRDWIKVNGVTTNYSYNALDQLTSAGSVTYQYDGRGNLNKAINGSQTTTYTYNSADQLGSVTLPNNTTYTYSYDADGRRVKQTVGSNVTNYLWDAASPYGDVVYEYNGSGATLASYVLGGAGLISQTRGSTTSYYLQDGQGSTRALTSSSTGAITDTYSYNAFGDLSSSTGTTVNPYRCTGQQFDTATGLYDLRARYYAPLLGRFLSQDANPFDVVRPLEINRYVYTADDPVNAVDPSGNQALLEYALNLAKSAVTKAALIGAGVGAASALLCGGDAASVGIGALQGALFGTAFMAGMIVSPGITYAATVVLGLYGAGSSLYGMVRNGPNACNGFNLLVSLMVVGGSARGLSGEVESYINNNVLRGLGSYNVPDEFLPPSARGGIPPEEPPNGEGGVNLNVSYSDLSELVTRLLSGRGFSYQPITRVEPTTGYMVGVFEGRGAVLEPYEVTYTRFYGFVQANSDLFSNTNNYFGGWPEEGKFYLDISQRFSDLQQALNAATEHRQLGVYDLANDKTIYLSPKLDPSSPEYDPDAAARWLSGQ